MLMNLMYHCNFLSLIFLYVGQYLFATPASPSVNSPPATTYQAGTSHHLLLQLHLDEEARKTGQMKIGGKHVIYKLCV